MTIYRQIACHISDRPSWVIRTDCNLLLVANCLLCGIVEIKMTTTDAGIILNIGRTRVSQLIAHGRIRATRAGRDWFIEVAEVERFRQIVRRSGRPKHI